MAKQLASTFIAHPSISGVVADDDGQFLGSNFLVKTDPVYGVVPITVEPSAQGRGIGRQLMHAALALGLDAAGIRLVQDAFNIRSISLYASLGFDTKEPLMLMLGRPTSGPLAGFNVRPLSESDVDACAALCTAVHGTSRSGELRDALQTFMPIGVERDGVLTGYLTAPTFWLMNHGVARTEEDMRALILGAAAACSEPLSFLLPIRQASFFRWCLGEGFRVVKPMTLMAMGQYQDPRGTFFPSVLYYVSRVYPRVDSVDACHAYFEEGVVQFFTARFAAIWQRCQIRQWRSASGRHERLHHRRHLGGLRLF